MIEIEPLPRGRFLLGFSGGVDSSALFFLLLHSEIDFDLGIVDYGVREQSKQEVAYAKDLACKYDKRVFCIQAPYFASNFEARAREFRYKFFSKIIAQEGYDGLILAHQFDDRLEWMMMQFCKGAGLNTLLGFDFVQRRENYLIYRPLWKVEKTKLYEYCKTMKIKYFEDQSNYEQKYTRNLFRKIVEPFSLYKNGILKSFEYLIKEKKKLYFHKKNGEFGEIKYFYRTGGEEDLHSVDQILKEKGYIISAKQRNEICKSNFSCEVGGGWIVESDWRRIYIAPKRMLIPMDKDFKDFARKINIPAKIRINVFHSPKTHEEINEFFT